MRLLSVLLASCISAFAEVVTINIDLIKESIKTFNDDEQESFVAAFTVVTQVGGKAGQGDQVEIVQIRSDKQRPGVKVTLAVQPGHSRSSQALVQKLSSSELCQSLQEYIHEPAGSVVCSAPTTTATELNMDAQAGATEQGGSELVGHMKTHHWVVVLGMPILLFIFLKYRLAVMRTKLEKRRAMRSTNVPVRVFGLDVKTKEMQPYEKVGSSENVRRRSSGGRLSF